MVHQAHDLCLKNAFQFNPEFIIQLINPENEFGSFKPTDIILRHGGGYRADIVYLSKDGEWIVNIELQTEPPRENDYIRYLVYGTHLRVNFNKKIKTVVLCNGNVEDEEITIDHGKIKHTIQLKSLNQWDSEEQINKINDKIRNNLDISDDDLSLLMLLPYMKSEKSGAELFEILCKITNDLKIEKERLEVLKSYETVLIDKFIKNPKKRCEIMEMIKVQSESLDMYINQKQKEYEQKGIEKGIIKVAKNLLKAKQPMELITKTTGLTEQQIEKLK